MTILRDYQRQALDAFWQALTPDVNRVALEMATGLGKTVTFAHAVDEWLEDRYARVEIFPREILGRALILVERDELVRQTVRTLEFVTRGRWSIGVVKAGQNEVAADIIVGSVDTLAIPGRREQIHDVGFIVVDECHHAVAPKYQGILEWFGGLPCEECVEANAQTSQDVGYQVTGNYCPNDWCATMRKVPVLGVSATLSRTDGQGLGAVFQDMPFSRGLLWGIRKGYLIDLVPYTITIPEITDRAVSAPNLLDTALATGIAPETVVQAWWEKATSGIGAPMDGYPSTVLFAPLVRSAQAFADAFNQAGVKAEVIHGKMSEAECAAIHARYEAGTTTVICNAMKLTEGWDSPRTMCVIVARPTQSVPLFIQMVGRGLRPWLSAEAPPREDQRCILLCVQGTTQGLATVADLSDKIGEVQDGKSLLAMEDEWDIGAGIEDAPELYAGPVRVEAWDALVQRSSKAWKYTEGGIPFLPTRKRSEGYVFITEHEDEWKIWHRFVMGSVGKAIVRKLATAPDLELAMALAEDEAQERGGDIGAMLADKSRPWRKAVPSEEMVNHARVMGVPEGEVQRILAQKSAGKAGRLSDLIDVKIATRVLDPVARKIKERG